VPIGRHLAILRRVAEAVSRSLDLEDVIQKSLTAVTEVTGHELASLHLLSPDGQTLVLRAERGLSAKLRKVNEALPMGEGLIGSVAARGRPLVVDDVVASPDLLRTARPVVEADQIRGFVCVPIRARERVLGTLSLGRQTPDPFVPEEVDLLESVADQIGMALDNASLFRESERRRVAAERFAEVGRLLSQSLDFREVAQLVADNVLTLLNADVAILFRLEPHSGDLAAIAFAGGVPPTLPKDLVLAAGTSVSGLAVRDQCPVATPDLLADPRVTLTPEFRAAIEQATYRAVLAVPLVVKDRVVGTLGIGGPAGRVFDPEEVRLAQALADQAAIALENSRLYSDLRAAIDRLKTSQQRVVETERLRAVGELASGVAHHLNNILAVILLRMQLLLPTVPDPEIRRALELVEEETREGAHIVNRLQAFTQAPALAAVDLNQLVRDVLDLVRPRWEQEASTRERPIRVRLDLAEIPLVSGESAGLRQVLLNLLWNSVDALPEGGTITVKTWEAEDRVYCSVADTGIGMLEDVRQRALEPFFTTKGPKRSGLGLSVSYGIVERHGGELSIFSEPGHGTVITFRLPHLARRA
jgi:signal transduction histidine kinase